MVVNDERLRSNTTAFFDGRDDTDEEALTSALLPLAGASQQSYVSELLSFTLDRLHKEPELLRVDAERIRRQMQEVAVGNYRAFIAADEALSFIRDQLNDFDKHLESLITEIPKLTSGCDDFVESAQKILEEKKLNQTLLDNHSTILDLLEIPQLMDTCIRNGNYDEALDLEAYVSKLSKMHTELPVIQALATEVRQTAQSLLSQLLQKLRSNIQLSECLRIIGHLRRIGVFNESEMRLQFLRCREAWLSGILDDLDQRNVFEYLKGMVNCHRMHLLDIVSQYQSVFINDKSGSEENYDGGLLFSWTMHQIVNHLNTLEAMLPRITDGVALSDILHQCMYCAMGLGLVGLDFRGLLPPIFETAVLNLFAKNMNTAVENFQVVLDSHRWVPLPAVGFTANGATNESQDEMTPPSVLMEHPPIAVFINGFSAAMNELRPCAPVSLKYDLARKVIRGLQAVSESLVRYNSMRVLEEMNLLFSSLYAKQSWRCYPNGATLIIESKSLLEGVAQLVAVSPVKGIRKSSSRDNIERKQSTENGDGDSLDNKTTNGESAKVASSKESELETETRETE